MTAKRIEMVETTGTLDLKIAQLERRLSVLKQQQVLSLAYPAHRARLVHEDCQLQRQLEQLTQRRQSLSSFCSG